MSASFLTVSSLSVSCSPALSLRVTQAWLLILSLLCFPLLVLRGTHSRPWALRDLLHEPFLKVTSASVSGCLGTAELGGAASSLEGGSQIKWFSKLGLMTIETDWVGTGAKKAMRSPSGSYLLSPRLTSTTDRKHGEKNSLSYPHTDNVIKYGEERHRKGRNWLDRGWAWRACQACASWGLRAERKADEMSVTSLWGH